MQIPFFTSDRQSSSDPANAVFAGIPPIGSDVKARTVRLRVVTGLSEHGPWKQGSNFKKSAIIRLTHRNPADVRSSHCFMVKTGLTAMRIAGKADCTNASPDPIYDKAKGPRQPSEALSIPTEIDFVISANAEPESEARHAFGKP